MCYSNPIENTYPECLLLMTFYRDHFMAQIVRITEMVLGSSGMIFIEKLLYRCIQKQWRHN